MDNVIGICKEYSKKRKQTVSMSSVMGREIGDTNTVEVTIGGATIFVTDIERFEQV